MVWNETVIFLWMITVIGLLVAWVHRSSEQVDKCASRVTARFLWLLWATTMVGVLVAFGRISAESFPHLMKTLSMLI